MDKIIVPHIGNYSIPVKYFLNNVLSDVEIVNCPKISAKTLEIGCKYSPDSICMPFKYTLGTIIEGLELGGNTIIHLGGGCRYGFYYELQKKILDDLNYNYKMINLITCGKTNIIQIYKLFKSNFKTNIFKLIYYSYMTKNIISYMDCLDNITRINEIENIEKYNLNNINKIIKYKSLIKQHMFIRKTINQLSKFPKKKKKYKILLIGELYTLMEPYSNQNIESILLNYDVSITRITNASFLLFNKKKLVKEMLRKSKIVNYKMGADSSNNLYQVEKVCKEMYDGVLHLKSSFCTPEIAIIPILEKVCKEKDIPIMYLSFEANESTVGLETRIEAFMDIIEMRNNNE